MRYYGGGSIIRVEHILFLAVFVVGGSLFSLMVGSFLQLGMSNIVNWMFQQLFSFLTFTPWWVWLITLGMGILFLLVAEK